VPHHKSLRIKNLCNYINDPLPPPAIIWRKACFCNQPMDTVARKEEDGDAAGATYAEELRDRQRKNWLAWVASGRFKRILPALSGTRESSRVATKRAAKHLQNMLRQMMMYGNRMHPELVRSYPLEMPPHLGSDAMPALASFLWFLASSQTRNADPSADPSSRNRSTKDFTVYEGREGVRQELGTEGDDDNDDMNYAQLFRVSCERLISYSADTAHALYKMTRWRNAGVSGGTLLLASFRKPNLYWENAMLWHVGHVLPLLVTKRVPMILAGRKKEPQNQRQASASWVEKVRSAEVTAECIINEALNSLVYQGLTPGFVLLQDYFLSPILGSPGTQDGPGDVHTGGHTTSQGRLSEGVDVMVIDALRAAHLGAPYCPTPPGGGQQQGQSGGAQHEVYKKASVPRFHLMQEELDVEAPEFIFENTDGDSDMAHMMAVTRRIRCTLFQVAHALDAAQQHLRFEHGDLHAHNIMVTHAFVGPRSPFQRYADLGAYRSRREDALRKPEQDEQLTSFDEYFELFDDLEDDDESAGSTMPIDAKRVGQLEMQRAMQTWRRSVSRAMRERTEATTQPDFIFTVSSSKGQQNTAQQFYRLPFAETGGRLVKIIDFGRSYAEIPGKRMRSIDDPINGDRQPVNYKVIRDGLQRMSRQRTRPPTRTGDLRILLFFLVTEGHVQPEVWQRFFKSPARSDPTVQNWLELVAEILLPRVFYMIYQRKRSSVYRRIFEAIESQNLYKSFQQEDIVETLQTFEKKLLPNPDEVGPVQAVLNYHGMYGIYRNQDTPQLLRFLTRELMRLYQSAMMRPEEFLPRTKVETEAWNPGAVMGHPAMSRVYTVTPTSQSFLKIKQAAEQSKRKQGQANFMPHDIGDNEHVIFCNNVL